MAPPGLSCLMVADPWRDVGNKVLAESLDAALGFIV